MGGSAGDEDREQRIKARAFDIWEREGRPDHRHDEHWRQAEEEVDAEQPPGRIEPDRAADAAPADHVSGEDLDRRQDQLLDEALEETFPGSDPISPKQIT